MLIIDCKFMIESMTIAYALFAILLHKSAADSYISFAYI